MVKLASVRSTRMYGPRDSETACEFMNAIGYMVASILLLACFILLLPGFINHRAVLIVFIIALILIILVNVHDLYAQLAGVDFRLGVVARDPQLALVEVGAPVSYTIGAILLLVAVVLMLESKTLGLGGRQLSALRLLVAGSVFWLLGSLHNAFQVYERTSLMVQVYQKAVYIPFLIATTLYLVSSILWMKSWPHFVVTKKAQYAAATLAIVASVLLVLGSLANISRVVYLRRLAAQAGSSPRLENLRGAARERLEMERGEHGRPLLHEQQQTGRAPPTTSSAGGESAREETLPYRETHTR